jgi:hypothetical protein
MNILVLCIGVISAVIFNIFEFFAFKYANYKFLLILCRTLLFIIPIYFLFDEFKKGDLIFFQYAAPFVVLKYLMGTYLRSKNKT